MPTESLTVNTPNPPPPAASRLLRSGIAPKRTPTQLMHANHDWMRKRLVNKLDHRASTPHKHSHE